MERLSVLILCYDAEYLSQGSSSYKTYFCFLLIVILLLLIEVGLWEEGSSENTGT